MTTNKLTVRACRERTQEIVELHKQIKSGYRGMSLERVQGLIDDLREDVIQTIANGSKCPYALTRLIANLPRVEYTTPTTATLGADSNEPLCYPLGMSPSELRDTFNSLGNSFDALRIQYGKLSHTITHLYSEWNSSSSSQSWDKKLIGMGYHYRCRYEFILFFEKGKLKLNNLGTPDILEVPRVHNGYPTEKPRQLFEILISQSTQPGAVIADPFMGSGSVGLAALKLGRDFLGNDISDESLRIATERLSNPIYNPPVPIVTEDGRLTSEVGSRRSS